MARLCHLRLPINAEFAWQLAQRLCRRSLTEECPGVARSIRGLRQLAECEPFQRRPGFYRSPECTRTDRRRFASSTSKYHRVEVCGDRRVRKAAIRSRRAPAAIDRPI